MDTPHVRTAAAAVEPLTALFGGMYLASLGMIMSPAFLLRHLTEIMLYVAAIYVLKVEEEEQEDTLIKNMILASILNLIPFLRCALCVYQLSFIRYEKVTVVTGVMRSFGFAIPAALSAGVILAQVLQVYLVYHLSLPPIAVFTAITTMLLYTARCRKCPSSLWLALSSSGSSVATCTFLFSPPRSHPQINRRQNFTSISTSHAHLHSWI